MQTPWSRDCPDFQGVCRLRFMIFGRVQYMPNRFRGVLCSLGSVVSVACRLDSSMRPSRAVAIAWSRSRVGVLVDHRGACAGVADAGHDLFERRSRPVGRSTLTTVAQPGKRENTAWPSPSTTSTAWTRCRRASAGAHSPPRTSASATPRPPSPSPNVRFTSSRPHTAPPTPRSPKLSPTSPQSTTISATRPEQRPCSTAPWPSRSPPSAL
jgi:hypothetical protein